LRTQQAFAPQKSEPLLAPERFRSSSVIFSSITGVRLAARSNPILVSEKVWIS
jgi:hypothetical protein